ncbi:MAG: SRPBCC domain-containing protein [Saprospiraceae bacterium]|nr:SRPBCC domain-containing protein [Saprospiraceae bacterium]MBK9728219.1 SRPBCC domain-containing protein [Saprospiraceae bacterium]
MTQKLLMEFTVNKENNSISVKREFAAACPLVWDAYTKPEILDQWWAPEPWKTKTKSMDFREGGHWHYAMVGPAGEEHWAWADYEHIQIYHVFTGLDAFADIDGNINQNLPQSKWEVKFINKDPHTFVELYITYPDLEQLEATIQMGFKDGLTMAMEGLDRYFTKQIK